MVIIALPSDPRKRPKKPATELPIRGKITISRYILNFDCDQTTKNQTMTERPVISARPSTKEWIKVIECYQETLGFASELKKLLSADFAHQVLV